MTAKGSGKQMTGEGNDGLAGNAVESVAFLARSEHRLHVLDLLADGDRSREKLRERTDATRVTLSRVLGDLEARGFIQRRNVDGNYELSTFGELVHRDFARLLGTVSVGQSYPDLISRLPTDWFDFDLQCLVDGEQVHGESADPLAGARTVANAIREGSSCASLVGTFTSLPMHAHETDIRVGGDTDVRVVFDSTVTEAMLEDQSLRAKWRGIEDATDSTVYYSLDQRVPCTIDLIDDERVFLTVDREQETGFDIISCSHPDVVAWADRVICEYRDSAVPLNQLSASAD
ncbi:helix-turn-helix transcriptional regulator [Haloarcula laminariae]|uniref:helix-turn-helix transcriptional regulator n=1 Tax=Haloarcula laminariae TaxID=2961577 RepID=UPI0021C97E4E|nr:ArsR family transcriptional regulator [Halomicroarcula laminariae]